MRWYQFRLISLLGLITLIAVGLGLFVAFIEPYRGQGATIALVERLGGTCQTVETEWWLRWAGEPRRITQVNVADCDEPEKYLAQIARLPKVELVIVGGLNFTDEHAGRLHKLTTLKGLILDSTSVSEEAQVTLREKLPSADIYASQRQAIAVLSKVGGFRYKSTNVDHPGLRELAGDGWFDEGISYRAEETADDAALAHLKGLSKLIVLWLISTQVTDAGLAHLKGLSQLESLRLNGTKVTDAGLSHLQGLSPLKVLYLGDTQVTDAGLAHLKGLSQLEWLRLDGTQVTDAGLVYLKGLSQLQTLDLESTKVADAGLVHLKGLSQLQILVLSRTQVTDAGLAHLKGLSQLKDLYLYDTQVTDAGVAEMRRALSQCDIYK